MVERWLGVEERCCFELDKVDENGGDKNGDGGASCGAARHFCLLCELSFEYHTAVGISVPN